MKYFTFKGKINYLSPLKCNNKWNTVDLNYIIHSFLSYFSICLSVSGLLGMKYDVSFHTAASIDHFVSPQRAYYLALKTQGRETVE